MWPRECGHTDRQKHTVTQTNWIYNLSHAIYYSYGADNKKVHFWTTLYTNAETSRPVDASPKRPIRVPETPVAQMPGSRAVLLNVSRYHSNFWQQNSPLSTCAVAEDASSTIIANTTIPTVTGASCLPTTANVYFSYCFINNWFQNASFFSMQIFCLSCTFSANVWSIMYQNGTIYQKSHCAS